MPRRKKGTGVRKGKDGQLEWTMRPKQKQGWVWTKSAVMRRSALKAALTIVKDLKETDYFKKHPKIVRLAGNYIHKREVRSAKAAFILLRALKLAKRKPKKDSGQMRFGFAE